MIMEMQSVVDSTILPITNAVERLRIQSHVLVLAHTRLFRLVTA